MRFLKRLLVGQVQSNLHPNLVEYSPLAVQGGDITVYLDGVFHFILILALFALFLHYY